MLKLLQLERNYYSVKLRTQTVSTSLADLQITE